MTVNSRTGVHNGRVGVAIVGWSRPWKDCNFLYKHDQEAKKSKLEVGRGYELSEPAPKDVLPPEGSTSGTAPPTGYHLFKYLRVWGTFFIQTS